MVILSEKHAAKFFEKSLSSAFFGVCPYSCYRILVQSMVQIIKNIFFSCLLVLQTSFLEFATTVIPMTMKLGSVRACNEILPSIKSHDLLITNLVRSREKKVDLHYRNAYGYQIWHGRDLLWVAPTHKVIWPLWLRGLARSR